MIAFARITTLALIATAAGAAGVATRAASFGASSPVPAGFVEGTPDLKSAGALAFGPDGVLFVGDSRGGAVFALSIEDKTPDTHRGPVEVKDIDKRIATLLGVAPDQVVIRDMAVNPATQHVFFSVSRGRGPEAAPALVRASLTGELAEVPLGTARFAKLALSDAPAETAKTPWGASSRSMAITDLAFTDGELLIAGLSNEQFSSTLRRAKFPFAGGSRATTLEIFHTSHGKYETASPIETFLPLQIKGQPALLAGYGCAPIAVFDMAELGRSKHVRGRTLAELGGGNRPSDMVAIVRDGRRDVLIANSDRTLMRIAGVDLDKSEALTKQASQAYEAFGTPYLSIARVGVTQLDSLNGEFVLVVQRDIETGSLDLKSIPTKWL